MEGPEDAQLVLGHLAVVPVAVLHARHPPFDVERARDVSTDDLILLDTGGVLAPTLEHGLDVRLLGLIPCFGPTLAELPGCDLLAEGRRLAWWAEARLEERGMNGEE